MIRSLWNLRRTNLNKTTTCLLLYRFQSNRIMPKAIVRCVDSEDTLNLSFIYSNPELGIKQRQFNFQRKKCEPLETAKTRICENVKRRAFKTNKKKKNKPQNGAENEHVTTQIDSEIQLTVDVSINQISCSADTPCKEAFIHSAILKIGDAVYDVVVNPPTVKSLSLPSNIMAGFPIYPKLEVEFTDKSQCSYSWYRTKTPINQFDVTDQCSASKNLTKPMPISDWEHIGNSFHYLTSIDDIGRLLRVTCTPRDATGEDGQLVEAVSPVTVSAGPGYCPFDGRHDFTQSPTQFGRFRVVSYNILADLYADSDFSRQTLFPYCPPYALDIDYRKQLILKEILGYNADLICLQEVDIKIYENELETSLLSHGLRGIFNVKGGQVAEGLACFYRDSKFRLVDHHCIILADAIQTSPLFSNFLETISKNEKLKDRVLKRTTALQVVVLQSIEKPTNYLCIGNTHLYFRPDADHIRLLQTGACLLYLEQIIAMTKSKNPESDVSLVICGDFNSTPEFAVYELMTTQFIPEDHADWSSNESEIVQNFSLSHSFQLLSACGTPLYTNFTVGFAGCLDYIFIDKTQLDVDQVVPLPSDDEIKQHVALPSVTMPSDHMALVCDLAWKK